MPRRNIRRLYPDDKGICTGEMIIQRAQSPAVVVVKSDSKRTFKNISALPKVSPHAFDVYNHKEREERCRRAKRATLIKTKTYGLRALFPRPELSLEHNEGSVDETSSLLRSTQGRCREGRFLMKMYDPPPSFIHSSDFGIPYQSG
ncbi:hypothetical protein CEXT_18671 [Caerostris extrusa]|uniref:Uncharacterized protein n=1 Tax=Caerostris extrusa TaxID=172846 RepID=A0AAV4PYW1_CAEEX|nr:hypothetical protein CEXT_18671 [Caerostris extrusa]